MRMDHRLSLIEGDVTAHPNHFELTGNGNFLVHFALGVKPSQRCAIQRSNCGEMGARNVMLLRKLEQPGKSLTSLVEDNRIMPCRFSRVEQLNLHPGSFAHRNGVRGRYVFACCLLRMPRRGDYPDQ